MPPTQIGTSCCSRLVPGKRLTPFKGPSYKKGPQRTTERISEGFFVQKGPSAYDRAQLNGKSGELRRILRHLSCGAAKAASAAATEE